MLGFAHRSPPESRPAGLHSRTWPIYYPTVERASFSRSYVHTAARVNHADAVAATSDEQLFGVEAPFGARIVRPSLLASDRSVAKVGMRAEGAQLNHKSGIRW